MGGGGGAGKEVGEVWGIGCCEFLLDFLGAGEVREDGGAFNGCRALDVEAGGPGSGGGVVGGGVAGAEVAEGYFVRGLGGVGGMVHKRAVGERGDGCVV